MEGVEGSRHLFPIADAFERLSVGRGFFGNYFSIIFRRNSICVCLYSKKNPHWKKESTKYFCNSSSTSAKHPKNVLESSL